MQLQHLTTSEKVRDSTRGIAKGIDLNKIYIYIDEAEQMDIKPRLGDAFFLDVLENPAKYEILLSGGVYTDSKGDKRVFKGLVEALNYFIYARIVKSGDVMVTRYGTGYKNVDESTRLEFKEKIQVYNDASSIGERYLKECLVFLKDKKGDYPLYKMNGELKSNRVVYRIIGK